MLNRLVSPILQVSSWMIFPQADVYITKKTRVSLEIFLAIA